MDFEQYLRENFDNGIIDFGIRTDVNDGKVTFYIHPKNQSGTTLDYGIKSNELIPIDNKIK